MRTNYCGLISEQYLDQTVTVKGWVHRRRDHGGVIFIDLRDREGIVQVVIDPDTPEAFAAADSSRNEYVLSITGRVRNRPEGTTNDKMISGKIEILAKEIEVLNAAATPPFQIDDENINENAAPDQPRYRPAPSGDAAQPAPALSSRYGRSPLSGRARFHRHRNPDADPLHA